MAVTRTKGIPKEESQKEQEIQEVEKPKYKLREGCGKHILGRGKNAKTIQPGQVVRATPEELAGAMDKFDLVLDTIREDVNAPEATLIPKHKGGGWYDVINSKTGMRINQKSLKQDEAMALLNGEWEEDIEEEEKKEEKQNVKKGRDDLKKAAQKTVEELEDDEGDNMEPATLPGEDFPDDDEDMEEE